MDARAILGLAVAVMMLAWPGAARAEALYTVSQLEVAAEAEDAVQAKTRALAEGVAAALRRVVGRIAVGGALADVRADDAQRLVASLSFEREAIGRASYAATLTVRFDPLDVRRYLAARGLGWVDSAAPRVLVVPVLIEAGAPLLWEAADAWRAALAAETPAEALAPAVLPANDRTDADMDADYLLNLDHLEMTKLRMRYGAHSVLLAIAEPREGGVRLVLRGEDAAGRVDAAVDVAGGLPDAAARVVSTLQTRWKRAASGASVATPGGEGTLRGAVDAPTIGPVEATPGVAVVVVLRHDGEWPEIERRLVASGEVAGLALEHMAPGMAEIRIWPSGRTEDLAAALSRHGLDLFQAGPSWMLQQY